MPWANSITLDLFDLHAPGRHIELPQAKIAGLRIHSFPFDVVDYFDRAAADSQFLAQHTDDRRKFAELLLQSLKVDQVLVQNFAIDDAQSPISQELACQEAEIVDLDPLNARSVALSGIRGRNGDLGLSIVRVGASDLHLIEVEPPKGSEIATRRALYVGGGSLEGLELGKSGVFIKLENLHFQSPEHIGVVPTALDAVVTGLTIPVQVVADPGLRSLLSGLELQSLMIDADLRAGWNEAQERVNLNGASVSVQNVGRLEARGFRFGRSKSLARTSREFLSPIWPPQELSTCASVLKIKGSLPVC